MTRLNVLRVACIEWQEAIQGDWMEREEKDLRYGLDDAIVRPSYRAFHSFLPRKVPQTFIFISFS